MLQFVREIRKNRDYIRALWTGYTLVVMNIIVQILLVPLYLKSLGKYQFGVLMILLSFINYAAIGIGWMSGGTLRVMAEQVAWKDVPAFARTYALSKVIYVGYALVIAIGMVSMGFGFDHLLFDDAPSEQRSAIQLGVLVAAVYLVVQYDFSVERLAFMAMGRQMAGNIFQMLSLFVFALCVIPWLLNGGGLEGVLGCLLGGVVAGRLASWVYWRRLGIRVGWRWLDSETLPLLRRLVGPMGMGYLVYGMIMLTMQADALIIGWLGGAEMAAQFVLVWKIAEVLIQMIWRLPEYYQPYLIQMDARGEKDQLLSLSYRASHWMMFISLVIGASYALFGSTIVSLWIGNEAIPESRFAYVLAGGAIFWLGSARLPAMYAYATIRLERLIKVAGLELTGKVLMTLLLFTQLSYLAPLAAINVMHLGGTFLLYKRIIK